MKAVERAYFRCSVVVRKEGDQYSSWCPELDVASSGETVETACENLNEAINCFLDTYSDLGELKQLLEERGIVPGKESDCPRWFVSEAHISVPSTS